MFKSILERATSLIFPIECEICKASLPAVPPIGVCEACRAGVKLIAPPHCLSCGRHLKTDAFKCAQCSTESFHFDRVFSCHVYEGQIRELLHIYKFNGRKYLKYFFAAQMLNFFDQTIHDKSFDIIIPVPLDPHKKHQRGFNQSELISRELAKKLKLSHRPDILFEKSSQKLQHLLTKKARKVNVQGRFFVKKGMSLDSKRMLLIDDVLTTGHTASECARVLKNAGAVSVTVLTCAS